MEALRHLRTLPQWRQYSAALERIYEQEAGKMFQGLAHDQYLVSTGRAQAFETALTLIDQIDLKASELDDHARHTTTARSRDLPFVGSVWWDAYRNPGPAGKRTNGTESGNG